METDIGLLATFVELAAEPSPISLPSMPLGRRFTNTGVPGDFPDG